MLKGGMDLKISSINNTNVNFGYNKKLNAELKQKLKDYPDKEWANTLSTMNNFCNKLETQIIQEEIKLNDNTDDNDKKRNSRFNDFVSMFLNIKQILAGYITITFDDLKFSDREFTYYMDEFIKNGAKGNDWRAQTCGYLSMWTETVPAQFQILQVPEDDDEKLYKADLDENEIKADLINQLTSVASKNNKQSFLEEFKPTEETPTSFSDVAGMSKLKEELNDGIISYVVNPEQAEIDLKEYGKKIPRGVLLYGPPGCGKTYITQALAGEVNMPLYMLNLSKAGSHYINMTSKNIQAAFDEIVEIAQNSDKPCILFMDEIDSLAFDRNTKTDNEDVKQVATLLQAMDNAKAKNVVIIGATNKFNLLDPAIRRRFDEKSFVDVPDLEARKALLVNSLSKISKGEELKSNDKDITTIAKQLDGFSNDSICKISSAAAINAMKRNRANISLVDYQKAISETTEEKPNRKEYLPIDALSKKIGFNK
jgi:SpoVK/Ycf46/Vps4 family AAA+-type ATPase